MHYVIMSSSGNVLERFDSEVDARSALDEMVRLDPEASEDVAMFILDESGTPVGDAVVVSKSEVAIDESEWLQSSQPHALAEPPQASSWAGWRSAVPA